MEIRTESGDVTVSEILHSVAVAGNAVLSGRFSGDGEVLVQTGDIVVGIPPQDAAELELEARVGDVVRKESC